MFFTADGGALGAAEGWHPDHAGARPADPEAREGSRRRHLRPRRLHPRRLLGAARRDAEGAGGRGASVPAAQRLQFDELGHRGPRGATRRRRTRRTAQCSRSTSDRRPRRHEARAADQRRYRQAGAPDRTAEGSRHAPHRVGPARRCASGWRWPRAAAGPRPWRSRKSPRKRRQKDEQPAFGGRGGPVERSAVAGRDPATLGRMVGDIVTPIGEAQSFQVLPLPR